MAVQLFKSLMKPLKPQDIKILLYLTLTKKKKEKEGFKKWDLIYR